MSIHHTNRETAVSHLQASGFRQLSNGNWINRSGDVAASIHPTHAGDVVCVGYWEVVR